MTIDLTEAELQAIVRHLQQVVTANKASLLLQTAFYKLLTNALHLELIGKK
jgi:hypothetical protein